jgi:hypothetical protein
VHPYSSRALQRYQELDMKHPSLGNFSLTKQNKTRGVSYCGLAIYINKYLKAKEELWKLKYFTMPKI